MPALRIHWVNYIYNEDFTYYFSPLWFFTVEEPFIGICLANLPLIQPILREVIASVRKATAWQKIKSSLSSLQLFGSGNASRLRSDGSRPSRGTSSFGKLSEPRTDGDSDIQLRDDYHLQSFEVRTGSTSAMGEDGYGDPAKAQAIEVTRTWQVRQGHQENR
jgi:hypothetical protein